MDAPSLSQEELNQVYLWVDEIPLSRPKKNIARDFADGGLIFLIVLIAEIVHHYFPKLVQLHNYVSANSASQKASNWGTLNRKFKQQEKVFKKLGFQISKYDIDHIITNTPDFIERVLKLLNNKIEAYIEKSKKKQLHNSSHSFKDNYSKQNHPSQLYILIYRPKDLKLIMQQKDECINQLKSTIEILQMKIKKMDQLLKLKDGKIQSLIQKLNQAGYSQK